MGSDEQDNLTFCFIFQRDPLYKCAVYGLFSAAHIFLHENYEKSTFLPDPIGPQITSFEYFLDL